MRTQKKHMIDFLFPIVLFFVFALSALVVILLAAHIYRSSNDGSSMNFTANTSLAYISEKIHQSNDAGAVRLDNLDGLDALVLSQTRNETVYHTYIYYYDGTLRELFTRAENQPAASAGTALLAVDDFRMEQLTDSLLRFTCTDQKGQTCSAVVSIN